MKNLSPSLEDYLEAIYRLEKKNRVARVKDIADALTVQMPSVTGALKSLRKKDLVHYEKNAFISLTEAGIRAAEKINSRHYILDDFLKEILLIDAEQSSTEACGIEHVISTETADRIENLRGFLKTHILNDMPMDEWKKVLIAKK